MSGMMGTMIQGAAFGAGSEVGHQAVRAMTGGSSSHSGDQSEPAQEQQQDQYIDHSQSQ